MKTQENLTAKEEKLLTRKEAAQLLNCNLVTFWRYTRDGRFPYYRVGRKMFFKRSEILDAIRVNND
ncbi:MAG: helix-turn-helix domain-containing protein [Bacteroidetes bacterium]|nr:helix-turn-helix domain-containing protein [Bacteroidota bacterium]MBL6964248.1 helix-turn-helix domain-containing protein [Bacteroidota bacterium]